MDSKSNNNQLIHPEFPSQLPVGFVEAVLTRLEIDDAAVLLSRAFFNNPPQASFYPDAETRFEKLLWLMKTNLHIQFALGRSFAARDSEGNIAAMGFWHPPGSDTASLMMLIRNGFWEMPFRQGLRTFMNVWKVVEILEQRRKASLKGRPSWFLNNMVVSPDYQGHKLGSSVLGRELQYVVDSSPYPASLNTQKAENVRFYEKLGFVVTNDEKIAVDGFEFPNWIMIYEGKNKRSNQI
mgnify:FL=1